MKNFDYVTDMAIESGEIGAIKELCESETLSFGITKHTLKIKNLEQSKRIRKPIGVYITFDFKNDSKSAQSTLSRYIKVALERLIGKIKRSSSILVVGLGNKDIIADSLGQKTVDRVAVTRHLQGDYSHQSVCSLNCGVLGTTGMQSLEVISGVVDRIKPAVVLLIDSLATSVVSRLGNSYQISTAGIVPGSGVAQDKDGINKEALGVPTISIGVPLMLSMHTALYNFIKNYSQETLQEIDEFRLREQLVENNFTKLIVSPKDIDYLVNDSAKIIANAINSMFE